MIIARWVGAQCGSPMERHVNPCPSSSPPHGFGAGAGKPFYRNRTSKRNISGNRLYVGTGYNESND